MRFYDLVRLDEGLNFVDQTPIKDFLTSIADRVENPLGKSWITSKAMVRNLTDRQDCAVPVDVSTLDMANAPVWLATAVERGDELFQFEPSQEVREQLSHIGDWIDGIAGAEAPAKDDPNFNEKNQFFLQCQKDLKSLNKLNIELAFEKAELWVQDMNKLNNKVSKAAQTSEIADNENFKVIVRFDNGCVGVSLISEAALKDEGSKMSHCVGGHGYWNKVQRGVTQIYSIRTPQGESACTIEVTDKRTVQVKGKGNRAPVPKYIEMSVELLNMVGSTGECSDLAAAGILWNSEKKKYGTFADIADTVVDKPPIKVLKAGKNVQLYSTKIGMIAQRFERSWGGPAWTFNKDLSPQEFQMYSTAFRSFVNKFAPLNRNPEPDLKKTMEAFNLIFDPTDNVVKPYDRSLMTHVLTTEANGLDVLRRGDEFFAGQGDKLVKISTDRNMRWMSQDILQMVKQVPDFVKMGIGHDSVIYGSGKKTLASFGVAFVPDPKEIQLPSLSQVVFESNGIQIGLSDNMVAGNQYQHGELAMLEDGQPVCYLNGKKLYSVLFGEAPLRANHLDALAEAIRQNKIPEHKRNELILAMKELGYDGFEMLGIPGLNYPLSPKTQVGSVQAYSEINQYGYNLFNIEFDTGAPQKLVTQLELTASGPEKNYIALVTHTGLQIPTPEMSQDIATAFNNSGIKFKKIDAKEKKLLTSLGLSFNKGVFEINDALRSQVVYQNGPVTVELSTQVSSGGSLISYNVKSSGDLVAVINCVAMANSSRINRIDYQDELEGPEAVADFINDKGKELKILPPKAADPSQALAPYGLLVSDGLVTVNNAGIDHVLVAWNNGRVELDDVFEGAYAVRQSKRASKEHWTVSATDDKGRRVTLVQISLVDHHVAKMETNNPFVGVFPKKLPMRLAKKFIEILDHVTEEEENN